MVLIFSIVLIVIFLSHLGNGEIPVAANTCRINRAFYRVRTFVALRFLKKLDRVTHLSVAVAIEEKFVYLVR